MIFSEKDSEKLILGLVIGLALVLQGKVEGGGEEDEEESTPESTMTLKQIKKLRAHDIFADAIKYLYKHRNAFATEARTLFRMGPEAYLAKKF